MKGERAVITADLVLTALFLIIVAWSVVRGLMRGFGRQAVHIGLTVVAAVISYVLTLSLAEVICAFFTPESIKMMVESAGVSAGALDIGVIANYLSSVETLMMLPARVIIAPIAFATTFVILNAIVGIISGILCAAFGIDKPNGSPAKLILGASIGLVEGLLVATIVLLPVAGIFNVADRSVDAVRDKDGDRYNGIVEIYDEYCGGISDHFAVKLSSACGGFMLDKLATVNVNDHDVNLRDESVEIADVVMEFYTLGDINYSALTEDNKVALRSAVTALENSEYLTLLVSGIFSDMGRAFADGVVPVSAPAPYDVIINPTIKIFATSNKDNFRSDVDTLLEIYFILSDSGVLSSFGQAGQESAMRDAFIGKDANGETTINKVVNMLNQNEHMRPIVKSITDMSLMMLSNQFGGDVTVAETYESVKSGLKDVVAIDRDAYSEEEYKAIRNETLNNTLVANNITLSADEIDGIGNYIDENYGDTNELSDEQFNDIIFSYYDVYLSLQSGGENP